MTVTKHDHQSTNPPLEAENTAIIRVGTLRLLIIHDKYEQMHPFRYRMPIATNSMTTDLSEYPPAARGY